MLSRRFVLAGMTGAAAAWRIGDASAQSVAPAPPPAASTPQRFGAAARYWRERGGTALVIRRNGVFFFDNVAPGVDPETPQPIGEATRLFAGLAAAALRRDRLLDLGEPVAMTLGDWGADPLKQRIVVRDLLAMTSGLASPGPLLSTSEALALSPSTPAGGQFADDGAGLRVFAEIARRKAERRGDLDIAAYLTRRVTARIAAPATFAIAPDGAPRLDAGAAIAARALSDVGELVRRRGVWRARQVLDSETTASLVRPSFANPRYGLGFWLAGGADGLWPSPAYVDLWRAGAGALPQDVAVAAGANGARLYIVPSRALVAVRYGSASGWSDLDFLRLLIGEG